MRTWRLASVATAVAGLIAWWVWILAVREAPGSDLEQLVARIYQAVNQPTSSGFVAFWTTEAAGAATARWTSLRALLPEGAISVAICGITDERDRIVVRVDPHADGPRGGNPSRCHTLVLRRADTGLKAVEESSPWEALADGFSTSRVSEAAFAPPLVRALIANGDARERAGANELALQAYASAREVARRLQVPALEATALLNIGYLQTSLGHFDLAQSALDESLRLARVVKNDVLTARALNNIGRLSYLRTEYQSAINHYYEGLSLARKIGSARDVGRLSSNLAAVQMELGDFRNALSNLQQTLTISRQIGDQRLEASALHNLGDLYGGELGDYEQALNYHRASFALKEQLGSTISAANTLHSMAQVRIHQEQYDEALALLDDCVRRVQGGKDEIMEAYALHSIGAIHMERGEYDKALDRLQNAIRLAAGVNDRALLSVTHVLIGEVYRRSGRPARARPHIHQGEAAARELRAPLLLWGALASGARLEHEFGATDAAKRYALQAIATIETMRENAVNEDTRQTFLNNKLVPYQVMTALEFKAGRYVKALEYAEKAKARVLLDTINSGRSRVTPHMTEAERQQEDALLVALRAANAAVLSAQEADLPEPARVRALEGTRDDARARLAMFRASLYARQPQIPIKRGDARWPGPQQVCDRIPERQVALVEYGFTESEAYVFTVVCGRSPTPTVAATKLSMSAKAVAASATQFREQLASRDLQYRSLATSLYGVLIQPVLPQIRGASALIIVPDGILWEFPFQALMQGDQFLVEQFPVAYAPSLAVLAENKGTTSDGLRAVPDLFAVGNPAIVTGATTTVETDVELRARRLQPLPAAEEEVRALQRLYRGGRSKVYLGGDARESTFKREAKTDGVLHLATHSVLDNRSPAHSFIVLAPDHGAGDDGLLEAWEVAELELHADLVVLSACETARGRFGAGEGLLGLSWSFFIAGVQTTVVSQWQVESRATTNLMVDFHRALLDEPEWRASVLPKARALQRAARRALTASESRHPFYWAAFVAIGTKP